MIESVNHEGDIQPADQESIHPPKMSHGIIFGKVPGTMTSVSRTPEAQCTTIVPRASLRSIKVVAFTWQVLSRLGRSV